MALLFKDIPAFLPLFSAKQDEARARAGKHVPTNEEIRKYEVETREAVRRTLSVQDGVVSDVRVCLNGHNQTFLKLFAYFSFRGTGMRCDISISRKGVSCHFGTHDHRDTGIVGLQISNEEFVDSCEKVLAFLDQVQQKDQELSDKNQKRKKLMEYTADRYQFTLDAHSTAAQGTFSGCNVSIGFADPIGKERENQIQLQIEIPSRHLHMILESLKDSVHVAQQLHPVTVKFGS